MATQKVFPIQPPTIIKYIIGEGGRNIKDIQEQSKCKVSINSTNNSILICGETNKNVENGWKLVEETMRSFGWRYSNELKIFQEVVNEAQKLFAELEAKIEKEASEMAQCFEKSQKAFKQDKKAEAKKLSDEGKKHQALMEQYKRESSEKMLNFVNKNNGSEVLDLHGQYSDFALEILKNRITELRKKGYKQLTVIYGAGNHSHKKYPIIKNSVIIYLKNQRISFVESNAGQLVANI